MYKMDSKYSCFISFCTCNNAIKNLLRSAQMFAKFLNVLNLKLIMQVFMSKTLLREGREGSILFSHGIHVLK